MSALRLVTFDVTNTLIKVKNSIGKEYMKVMQIYGNQSALKSRLSNDNQWDNQLSKSFGTAFKHMNEKHENFGLKSGMSSLDWWTQQTHQTVRLADFTDKFITDKQLDMMSKHLYRSYSSANCWSIERNSHEVLRELQKRHQHLIFGIISNNDERLEQTLTELGLRHYFNFVITSRNVGFCKPSKDIFDLALNRAKLSDPSSALHIGDDFDLDYLCAKKFGWYSLLKTSKSQLTDSQLSQITDNDIIEDLSQLLDHKLLH